LANKLAPLRLGRRIRFRDRWEGRLSAFEVDESWEVINLVIKRGFPWTGSVKLPFLKASDWSDDHISFDSTSLEAFDRQLAPVAAPGRLLSAKTPLPIAGARLAGALVEQTTRRVRSLLIRHGVALSHERKAAVEQVGFEDGHLRLTVQMDGLPIYRGDEGLQLLVREALARHPHLTSDDRRAIEVKVSDGTISLAGNVRTTQAKAWAEQAAASVDGALALRNEIVDDIHLEMTVAQALDQARLSRTAAIYIRSLLGEVTLFGRAPSPGVAEEIVRVASRVPGVRSVTSRLEVGEN